MDADEFVTVFVQRLPAHKVLGVMGDRPGYGKGSVYLSLPLFAKMLYEGNILAHLALATPYYDGDEYPRSHRRDYYNDHLVRNLNAHGTNIGRNHAKSVAHRRTMELDRVQWEIIPPGPSYTPPLGADPAPFDDLVEHYYSHF